MSTSVAAWLPRHVPCRCFVPVGSTCPVSHVVSEMPKLAGCCQGVERVQLSRQLRGQLSRPVRPLRYSVTQRRPACGGRPGLDSCHFAYTLVLRLRQPTSVIEFSRLGRSITFSPSLRGPHADGAVVPTAHFPEFPCCLLSKGAVDFRGLNCYMYPVSRRCDRVWSQVLSAPSSLAPFAVDRILSCSGSRRLHGSDGAMRKSDEPESSVSFVGTQRSLQSYSRLL
jgi:hypothetical protein